MSLAKRLLLTLPFLFQFCENYAQLDKIDSLTGVLSSPLHDTVHINTLVRLRRAYYLSHELSNDPWLADSILSYSKRVSYEKGKADGYKLYSSLYQKQGVTDTSMLYLDSAIRIYKEQGPLKRLVSSYNSLASLHYMIPNTDSSFYYLKLAVKTVEDNQLGGFGWLVANVGIFYQRLSLFDSSIIYLHRAMEQTEPEKLKRFMPQYCFNIANAYNQMDLIPDAVEYYEKCYQASMVLAREGNKMREAFGYRARGHAHFESGHFDSAAYYFDRSAQIYKDEGPAHLPAILTNLSESYLNLGRYNQAIDVWIDSYQQVLQYQYPRTSHYILFAQILNEVKAPMLVAPLAKHGLQIDSIIEEGMEEMQELDDARHKRDYFETLAVYYEEAEDYQKAYRFLSLTKALNDSLFNIEKTSNLAEMKRKYEIDLANQSMKAQEAELKSLRTEKVLWVILSILGTVCLGMALRAYFLSNKKKAALQKDLKVKEEILNEGPYLDERLVELSNKRMIKAGKIVYIQSEGNYLLYHLVNGDPPIREKQTMKGALNILPKSFEQVHRSYAINKNQIRERNKNSVLMSDLTKVPVGDRYRQ